MRGDFSRRTHRPDRHYSSLFMKQGTVFMDADWNEQVEIQLRMARQMMRDLVGPHGGPMHELGFRIASFGRSTTTGKLEVVVTNGLPGDVESLASGRYYVDGIMVRHDREETRVETDLEVPSPGTNVAFVYLEVWERHVTWIEENVAFQQRSMREVALGGPDTASRSEIRWRVKAVQREASMSTEDFVAEALDALTPSKGTLAASLTTADIGMADPCRDTAQARYRGLENRLYRVEIHAAELLGQDGQPVRGPTFKWSRENGSVVYPIDLAKGQTFAGETLVVEVVGLGRDDRYRLRPGNIVELVTAERDEAGEPGPLLEVLDVEDDARTVELRVLGGGSIDVDEQRWALLRRWDQPLKPKKEQGGEATPYAGAIVIDGDTFVLEDGISVSFQRPVTEGVEAPSYGFQVGDYWLIPARTIPGDIEWPRDQDWRSVPELPHGIERHLAPLAIIDASPTPTDLRKQIEPLAK